ncbi:EAL and HDOD domain-containing protein [Pseudodesulfovibrio piezophilus]|uniref:Diguanylate phosphodiesterase n=1 Tax=Pseudodesulfovibrio piezophilus (strain DSM 21447 / JCM 15486 / C1TLV30) TaxID=1322246 RepID=M1WRG9_PSEP2|nr:EAL domain-containing protein [Pseudodesulfovibrio piezophilus]CCH49539.1 Diguanylate phosphodiesterase [Pseudodesulfovibrio piezophilus C1TLV30]
MPENSPIIEAIFVARQPIFHADESVWGYELLFRTSEENIAIITDETMATSSVIADGLSMAMEGMADGMHILINFPEQMLADDIGFALPKDICVIEILEHVRPTPETLEAVEKLKKAGYTIAIDDFSGQSHLQPFMDLADIVKVDVLALDSNPLRIAEALKSIPVERVQLLAEKVENADIFTLLKALGFSLFQGFYFSKPEVIPGKKLSSNEMTKLQLLSELSNIDFDPKRLAEILQSDPSLSYRLFRYINSVGHGLRFKVTSLKRAIDMMGMIQAKHWLRTAVISDINPTPKAGELAYMSVQRAKFLESICTASTSEACQPDTMFITGLFSLLDAMLGMDMDDILKALPLDESIIQGLTTEGEIRDLLDLATSYEMGEWKKTLKTIQKLDMETDEADLLYARSRNWAQKMLGYSNIPHDEKDDNHQ